MSEKRFSRKGFLGQMFGSFASLAGELFEDTFTRIEEAFPAVLLPPGSGKSLERFMAACKRCGDCVRACPHFVIRRNPKRGSFLEGLPCLTFSESYCRLCSDWPCINACRTGALQRAENGGAIKIGVATVSPEKCLRKAGQDCQSCLGRCMGLSEGGQSGEGSAISIVGNVPEVDSKLCTGCGGCQFHCPVQPCAAVVVED